MSDIVKGSKELLFVIERMAMDKGIPMDSIINAVEIGLKIAGKKKYGHELNIVCEINKKNGDIKLYNTLEVVDDKTEALNYKTQISLKEAVASVKSGKAVFQENVEVGGFIKVELPPIDMNRLVVQFARTEIIKKVREAEKEKEYNEFINKVGSVVYGVVKKNGQRNVVVEVDGYETLLDKNNLIRGEYFRVGDRIKAYVVDVIRSTDNQIFLSRTDKNFLVELMKQEIPEMYDGLIEAKGVARDPGSKAKVAVYSRDNINDVVGICVGPRGARIQAVSSELRGEKIDVVRWSSEKAELVANLLAPAKVSKVVINDSNGSIDAVVPQDQLSLAIGRNGQNIRLASKIIEGKINIMTEEEEKAKRTTEFNENTELFIKALDVEEVIAQLLVVDGYSSVEEIAEADVEELEKIEGFDEDIATEIKSRAIEYLEDNSEAGTDENGEVTENEEEK